MKRVVCIICCAVLFSGCSWFADKRVIVKPKVDVSSPKFKKMLSILISQRYKSETLRWIETDKAYQEYLLGIE